MTEVKIGDKVKDSVTGLTWTVDEFSTKWCELSKFANVKLRRDSDYVRVSRKIFEDRFKVAE